MIKANYTEKIYSSWVNREILLNPELYINCEDEGEVIDMIWDDIDEQISYGDVNISDKDRNLDIPDEFWTEWEKLKKEGEKKMKVEFSGWETYQVYGFLDVNPKDFLDCEDEDEVRDQMSSLIYTSDDRNEDFSDGDVRIQKIPKKFFDEWNKLKSMKSKSGFDEVLGELIKKPKNELLS